MSPETIYGAYGADTLRLHLMAMGPLDAIALPLGDAVRRGPRHDDVDAVGLAAVVLLDPGEVVVGQPVDPLDRLVDEIRSQVIAGGEGARRIDRRVVAHQFRRELVGLGIHEAIEAVKAAPQGPAVKGATVAGLGQGRRMPLAHHIGAIALGSQDLGQGPGLLGDLAAIAGIAAVEIGQTAHPHRMVVAPGQQGGAGGGAHGRSGRRHHRL